MSAESMQDQQNDRPAVEQDAELTELLASAQQIENLWSDAEQKAAEQVSEEYFNKYFFDTSDVHPILEHKDEILAYGRAIVLYCLSR